jgi:hypothetical protein
MRAVIYKVALALVASALPPSAYGLSSGYQFTLLAKTGDSIGGHVLTSIGNHAINNSGLVVFPASFDGGVGIFTPSGVLVQTGDTIAGKTLTDIGPLRLNNQGTVAFLASFTGGSGIFTQNGLVMQIGDVIAGRTITGFAYTVTGAGPSALPFALDDAGTIVFAASCEPGGSPYPGAQPLPAGQGIFTPSQLLALTEDHSGILAYVTNVYSPNISGLGSIVFGGWAYDGTFNIYSLCALSQAPCISGEVGGSPLDAALDYPVINNSGSIDAVFENDSGYSIPVVVFPIPGVTILEGLPFLAMNNPGVVVFPATFQVSNPPFPPAVKGGLFTPWDLLIQDGDSIDGNTLASPSIQPGLLSAVPFNSPSINDAGTIVFFVALADGSSGIVMTTPINSGVPGDVNGDGVVDCTDLDLVKASFSKTYGQVGFNPRADVNGDGVIDIRDLAFVAQQLPASTSCH